MTRSQGHVADGRQSHDPIHTGGDARDHGTAGYGPHDHDSRRRAPTGRGPHRPVHAGGGARGHGAAGRAPHRYDSRRPALAGRDSRGPLRAGRGAAFAATLAVLLACGACADPVRKVSESSLRNATATDATDELRGLGYTVRDTRCRTLSADRIAVIRVTCAGRSSRGEPVRVDGVAYQAGSAHPRQEYVISVAGREVVRRPCLGQACRDRS